MSTAGFIPVPYPDSVVWYAVTSPALAGCLPGGAQPIMPQLPLFQQLDSKVKWTSLGCLDSRQSKPDTTKHFHVFVGDLGPEIDIQQLLEAFAPFGHISDCKVIRDPQTLKSRGYGFVTFVQKNDAESAIAVMNGKRIGSRPVRTNWAVRKPPSPPGSNIAASLDGLKPLSFEDVYNQTSNTNTTVYCGGVLADLTDDVMHETFRAYGSIQEVRTFKEKGYAFIRFSTKEMAAQAIVGTNGSQINGHVVRCAWGKEPAAISCMSTNGLTAPSTIIALSMPSNFNSCHDEEQCNIGLQWTSPAAGGSAFQQTTLPLVAPNCLQHNTAYTFQPPYSGAVVTGAQWPAAAGHQCSPLPPGGATNLSNSLQTSTQYLLPQQHCCLGFPMQQRG